MGRWLLWAAAIPVGAAALVLLVGSLLPRDHLATREARLPAAPARVAALVREVEKQPDWRRGVRAVEVVERGRSGLVYVERSDDGAIRFDFREEVPGRLFRSAIADPDLPFGGEWTIALAPEGTGTRIRIEERGSVRNPVYRFFSALVFGHEASMASYLADLEAAAG
jgi:hypothetical protein